jgi:hypothetical protein
MHFRTKAHNIHGWGELSDSLTVVASSMPEQGLSPLITIVDLNVKISWTAPNDNYDQISSYIVKIAHGGLETFEEETTYCDGSDSTITSL